jgi:hypothetical protein
MDFKMLTNSTYTGRAFVDKKFKSFPSQQE